jgi:hypothetical protein
MLQRRHENDFKIVERNSGINLLDNLVTKEELNESNNLNFSAYDFIPENTFFKITGISGTGPRYSHGCLTESNKIVFPPARKDAVLILDVATNTYREVPIVFPITVTEPKFTNAIYFEKKCYFVPYGYPAVMVFDPATFQYSFFGSLTLSLVTWGYGTLAKNGNIYAPPLGVNTILKINCRNKTVTELNIGSTGWWGSCLALNGKIYCAPHSANSVMVIDPTNDTHTTLSVPPPSETEGWNGIVCAQNGKMYGIPTNSTSVLVVNPYTNNVSLVNTGDNALHKYRGGALAPNGKIYCAPRANTNILVIDPTNDSTSLITGIQVSGSKYDAFVAAPNACLYSPPKQALDILVVRTGIPILGNWMFNTGFYLES